MSNLNHKLEKSERVGERWQDTINQAEIDETPFSTSYLCLSVNENSVFFYDVFKPPGPETANFVIIKTNHFFCSLFKTPWGYECYSNITNSTKINEWKLKMTVCRPQLTICFIATRFASYFKVSQRFFLYFLFSSRIFLPFYGNGLKVVLRISQTR